MQYGRKLWKVTKNPGIVLSGSDAIVVVYLNERTLSERAAAMSDITITSFTRARASVTKRPTNFCNFNLQMHTLLIIYTIIFLKPPNSYMFQTVLVQLNGIH